MSSQHSNSNYPKLHNAMWPGLVGKGGPGNEPSIDLDTMLDLTAKAEVDGVRFDGVDLFLSDPHVSIDISDDGIKKLADKIQSKGFDIGSVVAPVWPPTGGGSAMGDKESQNKFIEQVRKACRIAQKLRALGARPHGVVRIDSACGVEEWSQDPAGNQKKVAQTFAQACDVAEEFGERLAAEGEICWGGMHSWKRMVELLEAVNRPATLGFQADMAHTLLYILGYNAPEDAILPADWDWSDPHQLDHAMKTLTNALRPWTIDFHVAQNDATVKGSGSHDKTGHHCLPKDPNGKLTIAHHAGYWLHDENGKLTRSIRHICWDGCMFPNETMHQQQTWNDILAAMIAVRDAHGWREDEEEEQEVEKEMTPVVVTHKARAKAPAKPAAKARPAAKKPKLVKKPKAKLKAKTKVKPRARAKAKAARKPAKKLSARAKPARKTKKTKRAKPASKPRPKAKKRK
jgi:sugar phosphate isomerase/epimerase